MAVVIFHEVLKGFPLELCLRYGPEGKLCPCEGGRGSLSSSMSYSKLSEKNPCPVSHQTSVPVQQGFSQTQTVIFPLFHIFNFDAASAYLSSIKIFKWMLFVKHRTHFRLTLNETGKGGGWWTQRQCAWQKDPLPISLIVVSKVLGNTSSEFC